MMPVPAAYRGHGSPGGANAQDSPDGVSLDDAFTVPTRWWHRLDDGRVQCDVCPRACRLHEGQRGLWLTDAAAPEALAALAESTGCRSIAFGRRAARRRPGAGEHGPLGLLAWATTHDLTVRLLDLRTSADTAGGRHRVVGYGAFSAG
jgi:hypothetical protein